MARVVDEPFYVYGPTPDFAFTAANTCACDCFSLVYAHDDCTMEYGVQWDGVDSLCPVLLSVTTRYTAAGHRFTNPIDCRTEGVRQRMARDCLDAVLRRRPARLQWLHFVE